MNIYLQSHCLANQAISKRLQYSLHHNYLTYPMNINRYTLMLLLLINHIILFWPTKDNSNKLHLLKRPNKNRNCLDLLWKLHILELYSLMKMLRLKDFKLLYQQRLVKLKLNERILKSYLDQIDLILQSLNILNNTAGFLFCLICPFRQVLIICNLSIVELLVNGIYCSAVWQEYIILSSLQILIGWIILGVEFEIIIIVAVDLGNLASNRGNDYTQCNFQEHKAIFYLLMII